MERNDEPETSTRFPGSATFNEQPSTTSLPVIDPWRQDPQPPNSSSSSTRGRSSILSRPHYIVRDESPAAAAAASFAAPLPFFKRSRNSLAIHHYQEELRKRPSNERLSRPAYPRYQSYLYAPPEDPDASMDTPSSAIEPNWDDLVFFRRQGNNTSRTLSIVTDNDADELSLLLGPSGLSKNASWEWVKWTSRMWRRTSIFVLLPVAIVLAWCSVPVPYKEAPPRSFKPSPDEPEPPMLNFWFFLFFYYGCYNLVALMVMNKLFSIYSLKWWSPLLGGRLSTVLVWSASMMGGIIMRYVTPQIHEYTLSWVLLTFMTMTVPLLLALWRIQTESRNVLRHSLTVAQRTFVIPEEEFRARIPASYRRFLWFVLTVMIACGTLVFGGWYAYNFVRNPHRSGLYALIYVYSWVSVIYLLDFLCETIVDERIRCHPLSEVLRLYFYSVYFVFYRNLFVRLRDVQQFVMIQIASGLWVMTFYPIRMSSVVHSFLSRYFGASPNYETYQREVGQVFFTRNLAENATMFGFICWMNILHFGPNQAVYPSFQFNNPRDPYDYKITMWASCVIWISELTCSYLTRMMFKKLYGHSITREAVRSFQRFPEGISARVVVMVWVLMGMLVALIGLHFEPVV